MKQLFALVFACLVLNALTQNMKGSQDQCKGGQWQGKGMPDQCKGGQCQAKGSQCQAKGGQNAKYCDQYAVSNAMTNYVQPYCSSGNNYCASQPSYVGACNCPVASSCGSSCGSNSCNSCNSCSWPTWGSCGWGNSCFSRRNGCHRHRHHHRRHHHRRHHNRGHHNRGRNGGRGRH